MLENINDFLSLTVLVGIILIGCFVAYSIFLKHHAIAMRKLEDDYYQNVDSEDDSKVEQYL